MLSVFLASLKKGSGKTLVASGIAGTMQSLGYSVSYTKPIQTGSNLLDDDAQWINKIDSNIKTITSYKFVSPFSPLAGAYESGIERIKISKILQDYEKNIQMTECRIIEGSNSISSPINEKITEIDLISRFNASLILVVNPNISNIDEIISGVNYINSNHLNVEGIILNEYNPDSSNLEHKYIPALIKQFTGCDIFGKFKHYNDIQNLPADELISDTLHNLNLEDIFGVRIAKLDY